MEYVAQTYHIEPSLVSVLFLIGVHESGDGFRTCSRDRKIELIKLAQCILLSKEHFYIKLADPTNQKPVWIENPAQPLPSDIILEKLLKSLIVGYFNEKQI